MTHDTHDLRPDEWRSTIPPAEPCTDIGAEPDTTGDGGMIGRLVLAVALVFAALGAVHLIAVVLA